MDTEFRYYTFRYLLFIQFIEFFLYGDLAIALITMIAGYLGLI